MSRIGFVFPGQGAQYVGMGQEFYREYPLFRQVFDCAADVTGLPLSEICFEENEKINITEYTQIAMLAVSVGMLKVLEDRGVTCEAAGGLSLGEYGAVVASGAMTAEDAFRIVRKRGIYMQEAHPIGGAMSAVLGLDAAVIEKICTQTEGEVSVANYNCPGQIVITGEAGAVERAGAALKEAGARRILPLKVSGPFHSPLLAGAGEKLREELSAVTFKEIRTPYVTNVTGGYVKDAGEIRELLVRQVSSSVRWQQCVEAMIADGIDTFVEIGPGRTLTGFLRKIDRNCTGYNIEKPEDIEKLLEGIRC